MAYEMAFPTEMNRIIDSIEESYVQNPLEAFLAVLQDKQVILYGAGNFGLQTEKLMAANGVSIACFLDINAESMGGRADIPIYHPRVYAEAYGFTQNHCVVISIVLDKSARAEVVALLKDLKVENIMDAQELRARQVGFWGDVVAGNPASYLSAQKDAILAPYGFLSDDESILTYHSAVKGHLLRDYREYVECNEEQYLVNSIIPEEAYAHFVDCGAFIGDTIERLAFNKKKLSCVSAFEPDPKMYLKLVKTMEWTGFKGIKTNLYRFAVNDKNEALAFSIQHGSSGISAQGTEIIQGISLDEVLSGQKPTYIKMDVEGNEIKALLGAKNTITSARPLLGICVYHYINHFWEIPGLLHSWNLDYKFYMRTHSSCGMETVLYAVPEQIADNKRIPNEVIF